MKRQQYLAFFFTCIFAGSIASTYAQKRIVTLSGALTETIYALGYGDRIVAADVTSTYPSAAQKLPKVSHNRTVSAEGLISFSPDLILAPEETLSKTLQSQLRKAGMKLVLFRQEFSIAGAGRFIRQTAAALGNPAKGEQLARQTEAAAIQAVNKAKSNPKSPKVLFIYARGAGTMMVAGRDTHIDAIIRLAGGSNAALGFSRFKPYSTEALVNANPDIMLMFDFGYQSLGGINSILKMPGVSLTTAGKNKRIIQMDGELLTSFAIRLPQAINQLNAQW
jgi:iron complex transport system substrate-binding protein